MRKKLLLILAALVIVLLVGVLTVGFFLGSIIKTGVETFGPKMAKVDIKLGSADLHLLSGNAALKNLLVGNPEGFNSPFAFKADTISVTVEPRSVLADKVVVHSVAVVAPEVTLHGLGDNLKKIQANIDAATGGSGGTAPAAGKQDKAAGKKLQVDDFLLKGVKVTAVLPVVGTVALPAFDIHLQNLGTGADGITAGDLVNKLLNAILTQAVPLAQQAITQGAGRAGKEAQKLLDKAPKGIGNLFGK